ncbi:putative disease resistance protein RPP13-like, partial [Capsicum annuum]
MVDVFVSFAVQKLGDFLIQEVNLRFSLREDVQWLRNELLFMQSFLKHAEKMQSRDQRVQQWVFEINSVANDTAAILETYSFEAGKGEERLLAELLKVEPRRTIISIYGMGRLGKTTLARNLYNSPNIVSSFSERAWICVSQEYNTMDLLRNIIKSIQGRTKENLDLLEKMSETDLESYLRDLLKERKYLMVVDDVWQREAWESLKRAFPDNKNGSRIIITTRKEDVAERADKKEDQELVAENIIRLWMAEGFIPRGEEIMEDVAEGFLNELIRRSLVQVTKTFWEKVSECGIHDLLRDLAKKKELEVNFFDIYDPRKHSISSLCLRNAAHGHAQRYLSLDLSNLKLRSIMIFDPDFGKPGLINLRSDFQHIYVLHLDIRSGIKLQPDAIGSLYHLKFLRLNGISDLPSSIGNLKNLQTLHVSNPCHLAPATTDLINIRHLVAWYSKPLKCISKLTNLQLLEGICCDQWKDVDPVDFVNLRELSMCDVKKSYSLNNISSLKDLSTLSLESVFIEPIFKFHHNVILPESKLKEDPMHILGTLPNLRNRYLFRAYEGKEITCSDNNFCQLEFLNLDNLENLERWNLATSSMPLIKGLGIHDCPKLKEIPLRMKDVEMSK